MWWAALERMPGCFVLDPELAVDEPTGQSSFDFFAPVRHQPGCRLGCHNAFPCCSTIQLTRCSRLAMSLAIPEDAKTKLTPQYLNENRESFLTVGWPGTRVTAIGHRKLG
jgi:hypothetical protein